MDEMIAWFLAGPPWVRYRARLDLAGEPEDAPQVLRDRRAMLAHPRIKDLVAELQGWPGPNLKSHKDAKHPLHKLAFLADLGLRISDCGVEQILTVHRSGHSPTCRTSPPDGLAWCCFWTGTWSTDRPRPNREGHRHRPCRCTC